MTSLFLTKIITLQVNLRSRHNFPNLSTITSSVRFAFLKSSLFQQMVLGLLIHFSCHLWLLILGLKPTNYFKMHIKSTPALTFAYTWTIASHSRIEAHDHLSFFSNKLNYL